MKREMKVKITRCRSCEFLDYTSTSEYIEYWCNKSDAKTGRQTNAADCCKPLEVMFENCTVWEEHKEL